MPLKKVTASAVVTTYKSWEVVRQCLPTVLAQDWPDLEIIVVDDSSQDGTAGKIQQAFPGVKVLELPENLGFDGACNAGVEAASGDYVALLNDDVFLPPDFISRLVAVLEAEARTTVAGPAVRNMNMNMDLYPHTGSMGITGKLIDNVFREPELTFGAAGCALLFKRQAVGLPFDADYRIYHDEVYLAWRERLRGHDVARLPGVEVRHIGGATMGSLSDSNRYLLERNRMLNFLTLFAFSTRARLWPLLLLGRVVERLSDWRSGRSWEPVRQARIWIRSHPELVRNKRAALQSQRRVPDQAILRWMSYKLTNQPGIAGKIANALAYGWCWLLGIRTWEMQGRGLK